MSSKRVSYNRKRRTDSDRSDSEPEDISPIKKQKKSDGTRFKSIWQWMLELPLTNLLREKMSSLPIKKPSVIQLTDSEDDENEIDVTYVDEVSSNKKTTSEDFLIRAAINGDLKPPAEMVYSKPRYVLTDMGLELTSFRGSNPLFSSTPLSQPQPTRSSLQRRPLKSWNETCKPKLPMTHNGDSSEDIVIDDSDDESDVEVIGDVPSAKRCDKTGRENGSRSSEPKDKRRVSVQNGKSSDAAKFSPRPNFYTACEVVRMQEKEQYRVLLDKCSMARSYRPGVSALDFDLSEILKTDYSGGDSEEAEVIGSFKKRPAYPPIPDLLQKYYKPCPRKPVTEEINLSSDDDEPIFIDEDVQIIGAQLPKYQAKDKSKHKFFSNEWISEMRATIISETQQMQENLVQQENKIKRYKDRRDAQIEKEKKMYEIIWMKKSDNEFPDITNEMKSVIYAAFAKGDPTEVLVSKDTVHVNRADIQTLNNVTWLNDQVIQYYIDMIIERSKNDNFPSCFSFNTFFYGTLKARGPSAVMRWTRKVDIFSYDILFVPLHLDVHWALCAIDNRTKTITYYDSMKNTEARCLTILRNYLVEEMNNKKKIVMDPNSYSMVVAKDNPQQMNGSDCGVFTCKYAEYISRDSPFTFNQSHMWYFRQRMVYEIITGKLL